MLDSSERDKVIARLNRVQGQLRGIHRMIEAPRPCVEILQQIAAAEGALARISYAIFKAHVERCVPNALAQGGAEQRKQLRELVDIFDQRAR